MSPNALGNFHGKQLVVFGAGYVGGAIVEDAVRRGAQVIALTRNSEKAARLTELGAAVIVSDLASADWHEKIGPAQIVINCVSSGGGGAGAYQRSYVEGTQSILAWLRAAPPAETFLYTSSTSVYPQSGGVVDETAPTDGAGGTAQILLKAEALVKEAAETKGCRQGIVLRLAGIYGPGRHHVLDQLRAGSGLLAGRGEHRLNLIHRDDIVSAIFAALQPRAASETYEVFNVVDDGPVRKADMVEWLARRLGLPVPGFSGEAVSGRRSDPPDRVVSNAKIKANLGWKPHFSDFRSGYEALLGA